MKKILVTGGCGYIGSHTILDLVENGFEVISIDNFSNSTVASLDRMKSILGTEVKNFNIDLCELSLVEDVFIQNPDITGIIHFAALKAVGESVQEPLRYYNNNIIGLLNILSCCKKFKIENLVFSSSCSVYGNAEELPVNESTPLMLSESPYAETKVMAERIIADFTQANFLKTSLLRYFNPIGAHHSGLIGEDPLSNVQNIIPRLTGTVKGIYKEFKVWGNDYDTKDGTCIRDYIHVSDIANGHTLAIKWLLEQKNKTIEVFNMGSGNGVSVLELINAFEEGTNQKLNYSFAERRAGDVVEIYANNNKAKDILGWKPEINLIEMMRSVWKWEQRR